MRGRRRWIILILLLLLYSQALTWLCVGAATVIMQPIDGWRECASAIFDLVFRGRVRPVMEMYTEPVFWWYFAGPSLYIVLTQVMFLLPAVRPPRAGNADRALRNSLVAAGLVGAGLATGLFLAAIALLAIIAGEGDELGIEDNYSSFVGWVLLPLGLSWLVWTVMIAMFARPRLKPNLFTRILAILFGATLIEVLIVLPLDIMVRRRTNCYCSTGTAHTLGLAAWAGIWLAGPGIVLALTSKRRRWWYENHCAKCGYEKGPSPGERCPECGHAWESQTTKQPDSQTAGRHPWDRS